jgi:XTP/dITP diphosphohydrolase
VRFLVATRSPDKLREIRAILRGVPELDLIDLNDARVEPSEEEEGIEAFDTFAENALAKAHYFRRRTGLPTIADDSGIVVDALDGAPGVRSKRFSPAGLELSGEARDRENLEHLLRLLGDLPLARRTARYVCVAALDTGEGEEPRTFSGTAEGLILGDPRGRGGFGYDPIFFDQRSGKSFAELTPPEKDGISHRGAAFRALGHYLSSSTLEGGEAS